jgi:hypothetical protein
VSLRVHLCLHVLESQLERLCICVCCCLWGTSRPGSQPRSALKQVLLPQPSSSQQPPAAAGTCRASK